MPGVTDTVVYTGDGGRVIREEAAHFVQYLATYHGKSKRFGTQRAAVAWLAKQQVKTQELLVRGR